MSIETQTEAVTGAEQRFDWPVCYEAEDWLLSQLESFCAANAFARRLSDRMRDETGTLFIDWVDHLVLPADAEPVLNDVGFRLDGFSETTVGQRAFRHPDAMLPRVLIDSRLEHADIPASVAIKADSLADFMVAHGLSLEPVGEPFSRYRRMVVSEENGCSFEVVERRGYGGFLPSKPDVGLVENLLKAHELWRTRRRDFGDDTKGFKHSLLLLDRIIEMLGRDLATHVVFAEERAFWQRRNRAAQVQKQRQDALGLGWANHDHHTFRCSRRHFLDMMAVLERLGFRRRERFYAGAEAGWGAQISEHPIEGIVTFCDVDLRPEDTEIDFSRIALEPSEKLGTVGLWVGLHGESFLQAGMHHLECRFDHALLRDQMAGLGINTMKPFSDLPFLKQAFTEGERWPVRREQAERLLNDGLITREQFDKFLAEGAIGSHLENLQRKGGFKGFNQKSVSAIIDATDPRKQAA